METCFISVFFFIYVFSVYNPINFIVHCALYSKLYILLVYVHTILYKLFGITYCKRCNDNPIEYCFLVPEDVDCGCHRIHPRLLPPQHCLGKETSPLGMICAAIVSVTYDTGSSEWGRGDVR